MIIEIPDDKVQEVLEGLRKNKTEYRLYMAHLMQKKIDDKNLVDTVTRNIHEKRVLYPINRVNDALEIVTTSFERFRLLSLLEEIEEKEENNGQ